MTIQSGNDKERAVSWNRAKAGTIATVVLLVAVVTAAAVAATPGSRPEVEDNGRAEHGARPLKADLEAREAAFLEHLDAKVEAGELTRAEADEMIANMEDQHAEHLKGTDRDARPSKADLAERKAAFLEDLDAKVEAGELTRAEADEMITGMKARIAEHLKGAERDARPLKADLAERRAAFLEGLDAKVEAGELTRAEADEIVAGMKARIARHRQRTTGDTPDMSAALALARS